MLFDEPFSALDRKLRETMQIELRRLLRELGTTAIFVTHDQDEALVMSDRIAIMNLGSIEQLAAPAAIYEKPATAFALDFVGLSTRLEGRVARSAGGEIEIDTPAGRLLAKGAYMAGAKVTVGVRPERVRVGGALAPGENGIELGLRDAVYLGSKLLLHFDVPDPDRAIAEVDSAGFVLPAPGARLILRWRVADTLVFPEAPVS
jgi:putative spermidine/putrescine transport system ATP-binding protein